MAEECTERKCVGMRERERERERERKKERSESYLAGASKAQMKKRERI